MANIFEDISNKLKSLSSNNPSGYDKKYVEGLTSIVKAENKPTESAIKGVPTTSVTKSNNSTKAKNSTVKTYNDFGNDADYERYLVENNISKTKGEALSYLNSKAKENGTTARQYSIDMTNRVKNTLNTEKLEKNQNTLTDAQKEAVNQFGVIVDSKGNEVDSNTYNNNINLFNETATNINNQITELNNAYTNGQIDYNTMQTKYNELQNKWNENQLVGEDLSNYKTLTGFDYYNWAKENGKDVTEFEKYAESIDDSWLENLTEVYAASVADAINTPVQTYEILKNIVTGEDFTDENSYSSKLSNASAELRQYAYAGTSGVKKWSTQVVDSLLPMAHATISAIAIGSATGLTAGMDKIASTKVANKISLGILGTQTAGQVTRQRIQEGNDLTSAVLNGTLHGAITGLVESIGGEGVTSLFTGSAEQYLFANALFQKANPLNIAKYINAVGMAEGAEEVIETIADAFADNVQNWITGFFDGTALKKVNATEIDPSEMFNSFVMGYAGAVILGTPTAFNVSLNSKGKYNVSEQVKQYFKSTLNSDIASVQEKDLAYKCIELINEAQGNSSYKMNSQVSDAITLNTDYSPTTYTYEDVMNNLVNAVQSDVQGELKTATETLSKAKELGTLFQKSLNERGININSQEYMNLSTEAKNTVTSVTKYAQDLDREVVWKEIEDRNGNAVDGIYSKSLGKIILNPNGKQEVLSTLVHEYTHSVEKSTKYFGQLKNLVEQYLGKEKFELAKNRILKDYADITDIDEAGAEAEVVAFTLQKELGKEDFVNRLIKYNGSLAVRIYEDIKHAIGYDSNLKEIEYLFKKAFTDNNTKLYEAKIKETTSDVAFSIAENDRLIDDQKAELTQMAEDGIIQDRIEKGIYPKNFIKNYEKSVEVMNAMRDIMAENLDILPDDKIGETLFSNGSYDVSTENTTDCVRTLGYKKLLSLIEDKVNRPLSYMESMLVSQKLYEIAVDPQCLYCYVSLDRKGFDDALLKYFNNRNKLFQRYEEMGRPEIDYSSETIENQKEKEKARKNNNPLFKEFLKGNRGENRKATDVMWNRFTTFIENYKNGATLLSQEDVRNEDARKELLNLPEDSDLRKQYLDAHKYAQSASWAKISHGYRAYGGDILALNQETVDALNSHYGMRWYSFSDYTAAFILENMQQITDASIKGLKGLAYTKDTDFVKIFAPTGMGINISVFVDEVDGQFVVDPKQSANLLEAIELRKKFDNVGIVVVATNDNAVKWALNQEWSDVVIPFHIVKGGNEIAQQYGWDNYKNKQSDKVKDKYKWQDYLREYADNIGKNVDELKGVPKMVMPHEHHNDINEYLRICQERGLKPRFDMFLSEPNYMKLVNETRQSDLETSVLQPNFDLDEAKKSFEKFKAKGGYYNGWYNDGVDLDTEAQIVANDISEIKKGNTTFENVPYANQKGRAFKDLLNAQKERWGSTQHGQDIGALRYSNGTDIDTLTQPSNETDASGNTLSVGMADYLSNSIGDRVDPSDINSPHMEWEHGSPNAIFTEFDNSKEKVWDNNPNYVNKSKAIYLTSSHDVASTYSLTENVVDPNNVVKLDTFDSVKQYVNENGGDIFRIEGKYYLTDVGTHEVNSILGAGFDLLKMFEIMNATEMYKRDKEGSYYDYFDVEGDEYETVNLLEIGTTKEDVVDFAKNYIYIAGNYKLYAKSENPLIIDAKGNNWDNIETPKELSKAYLDMAGLNRYAIEEPSEYSTTRQIEDMFYTTNGIGGRYDSIRYLNIVDNGRYNGAGASDILVVFNSNQVKSVDNLTPTTNSDIRYSKGLSIDELTKEDKLIERGVDPSKISPFSSNLSNYTWIEELPDEVIDEVKQKYADILVKSYGLSEDEALDSADIMADGTFSDIDGELKKTVKSLAQKSLSKYMNKNGFYTKPQITDVNLIEQYLKEDSNGEDVFKVYGNQFTVLCVKGATRERNGYVVQYFKGGMPFGHSNFATYNEAINDIANNVAKVGYENFDIQTLANENTLQYSKGMSIDELTEIRDRNQQELDRQNKLEEQARTMDQLIENDLWGDAEAVRKGLLNIRNEAGVRSDKATMDTLRAAEKAADESVKHIENATDKELRELAEQVSAMNVSEEALNGLQEFATNGKTTTVLSDVYKKDNSKKSLKTSLYNIRQKLVDKGQAVREIARKVKSDKISSYYDYYLTYNNIASRMLTNGINTNEISSDLTMKNGKKIESPLALLEKIPKDLQNDFDLYMYHGLNTNTAKIGKNTFNDVSAEESAGYVQNVEKVHPEWIPIKNGILEYCRELKNLMVEHELIDKATSENWSEMYPNFIPTVRAMLEDTEVVETDEKGNKFVSTNKGAIKERTGGSQPLQPLSYALDNYTRRVVKSCLLNDFAKQYVQDGDNVAPVLFTEMFYGGDERLDNIGYDSIQSAKDGQPAMMVWYDKGQKKIMQIPQGIYDAIDTGNTPFNLPDSKLLTGASKLRRNLITGKNPLFMITNPIKDAQEIIFNSKHPLATYGKLPKAWWQLVTNGEIAQYYKDHGGEYSTLTSEGKKTKASKFYENTIGRIEKANEIMELTPRLAEFMASIEKGRNTQEAMYDSYEVTCNFKRGGEATKWADRNGAVFLNASTVAADKQVRMIEDAYDQKGWKGVLSHMAKATLLYSLPLMVINALRWKDDEDYEQLSDYIKDNYYILFKYGDGKFFRIPKGRVAAAYQGVLDTLYENGVELASDDSLKEKAVSIWENSLEGIKSAYDNIGVNNPLSNNIFAPAIQTLNNETWYGDPIVSEYMAKKDNAEQYDYSTDKFSVWLGKQLDLSPKKINYLLDQYSGAIGDVLLPVFTPKAETGLSDGSVVGNVAGALVSPLADKFTTDSVFKNQDVTDFYTMVDELYTRSTKENASDEEKLAYKYMNSIKSQMNKLYTERNDIYNSDLNDKDKYAQAKEVQKQVVELAQSGLATYDQIDKYENYAEIGGIGFTKDEEGNWTKANTETVDFINDLDVDNKVELKQRVLGATGITENGKTVRNSKALEVADAYADMGVLDDVFAYIEANGIDPTEVGLNKTVASKSYEQIKSSYEDVYGEVFGNGDYQPTTSQTSKTSTNTTTKTKKAVNAYFNALKGSGSDIYSGLNIKTTKVSDVNKKVDEILKNL